ncbi:MAG: hypothetical protein ACOYJF_08890 [Prevotella sp.]|jgi:hypothetical protein
MDQKDSFHPTSRLHRRDEEPRFLKLRNVLNIIFMLGAIVGIIIYFTVGQTPGIIVVLCAMLFKMVESVLRFMH